MTLTQSEIDKIKEWRSRGLSYDEIVKTLGHSKVTLIKYAGYVQKGNKYHIGETERDFNPNNDENYGDNQK